MRSIAAFKAIQRDLESVEKQLLDEVKSPYPLLAESASHLVLAGGKRLRPALVLLGGKFNHYSLERLKPLAVSVEMVHMATLVHDDVIDDAATRRGVATVKTRWGDQVSINTGDFLFGRSLVLAASYANPAIFDLFAYVSAEMCRGEIQQTATMFQYGQSIRDYFYRIKRKTALLIAASCQLGAMASGASEQVVSRLGRFGHYMGMAFQIKDDVLDFVADQKKLGKPVGGDLAEGILTLPAIHALKTSPERQLLAEMIAGRASSAQELEAMVQIIKDSASLDYSMWIARRYVEKAKEQIRQLPDVPPKKALAEVAEFVMERNF